MQNRMKEFTMSCEAIDALLHRAQVGRISTIGADGYPYTVAIHFLYENGQIYFHGLPVGQKLENIIRNPKVCFETDELSGYLLDDLEIACKADTIYKSVVIQGDAAVIRQAGKKREILEKIIAKYAPQLLPLPLPENRISGTAVVEIRIREITGKYHK